MSILKILQVEGLPHTESEFALYIHINNILQEILTPPTSDHSIILPTEGELKLILKTINDSSSLSSLSLDLNSLKFEQTWLNLQPEAKCSDYNTRVQISLEPCDNSYELSMISNELVDEEVEYPRLRLQLKMQTFSIQEMSLEIQSTKQKLFNESKLRQSTEQKLQETVKEYTQFVNMAQAREKSMLKLLEQKDLEIAENINQTLKLQGYLDRLLEDKRHVEEKLACLKTLVSNDETEVLRQQVTQLKNQLAQEDKRRQELQEMLMQIGKEWRETEDQEKTNYENKLVQAEQDVLRSNSTIQDLQIDLQRFQSQQEKNAIETQLLNQELERTYQEKKLNLAEISDLKGKIKSKEEKIEELNQVIESLNRQISIITQENEKNSDVIQSNEDMISLLEKNLKQSTQLLHEEQDKTETLSQKLQEEKIYCNRLNDQILQERLSIEKCRELTEGPDIDTLIDNTFASLKMENSILKIGESYFYDGSEVTLSKKVDYWVQLTSSTHPGPVTLTQFLQTPRAIDFSLHSVCSKVATKGPKKLSITKLPLKERNLRTGSNSVERKKTFK